MAKENPLSDNCPACVPEDGPFEPTQTVDGTKEIVAFYRCPNCGHKWSCSWWISALGPVRHDAA